MKTGGVKNDWKKSKKGFFVMTDAHHSSNNTALYVLPLSIILASLIVSGSILFAFSGISSKTSTQTTGSVVAAQAQAPSAQAPSPSPSPSQGTAVLMSDTIKDAAATRGDPNASVIVVEYSDYQCPFCRSFFEDAGKTVKTNYVDTGKVLFVYKDFPLQFHEGAEPYALAARCAGDQGKYWEMHDTIFVEQGKQGTGTTPYSEASLKQWAQGLGLNATQFNSCFDSGKYKAIIQSNIRNGTTAGVNGTPSFLVGKKDGTGQLIVGAQPSATFEAAIEALLQ